MSAFSHGSRLRLALFWSLFAAAAVATALAVAILHATVRAGQAEQEQRVIREETIRARTQVAESAARIRQTLTAALVGFHADGLARTLRRWDEGEPAVSGTFRWDPAGGFEQLAPEPKALPGAEALARLWTDFEAWRAGHPGATVGDPHVVGEWRVAFVRTLNNPDFPERDVRYQAENLDVLAHAGRPVDPWAGWAAPRDDARAPWIIWYRPGPDAPVRGCFVDVAVLVAGLQTVFSDTELVRVALVPADSGGADLVKVDDFPAHRLSVTPGTLLMVRHSRVQLSIIAVALLAALFVIGAGLLGIYSRREARDAERKTTFVSQVSHELRTPLTSIRMFADMLAAPGLSEEKRLKFAGTISRESQRLAGLIERLLAFNALARGKSAVSVAPVDVAAVVRDTLEEQGTALHDVGLRLEMRLPDGTWTASTDASAVKQALLNLLDNAVKYARDGGVVGVGLERRAGRIVVSVADRGPGIPARQRAKVFEPFVQGGDQALTSKVPGLGLGLSLARGLLRRAGGDLTLVRADAGCTFEISLPEK